MSANVYSALIEKGFSQEVAAEITEATYVHQNLVTIQKLDVSLAEMELRMTKQISELKTFLVYIMLGMTGIFAFFVGTMAWVIKHG